MVARSLGKYSCVIRWLLALALVGSLSIGAAQVVRAVAPDAVTIEASPASTAAAGTTVTFTGKVLSNTYYVCQAAPCGTVTFQFTGATNFNSPNVALAPYDDPTPGGFGGGNGIATYQTAVLAAGVTHVVVQYNNDGSLDPMASAPLDYTITGGSSGSTASTTTILAASGGNSSASMLSVNTGDNVTFTATVAPTDTSGSPPTPTGNVQFMDGITPLGSPAALNGSGIATFATTSLTSTSHSITAVYLGDATYASSTSSAVMVTVTGGGGGGLLSNTGIASPPTIASGFALSVDVTLTDANTTANAVSVDLTQIGLGPTALTHRSGARWNAIVTVPNAAPVGGPYSLPVTLTDTSSVQSAGMPLSVTIIRQARSISITPGDGTLIARSTKNFTLTATYTNGQTANVSASATWRTGSTTVATVTAGQVTAGASGSTTLTASYNGLTTSIPLTVVAGGPPIVPPVAGPSPVVPPAATSAPPMSQPMAHPAGNPTGHTNGAPTSSAVPNPAPSRH